MTRFKSLALSALCVVCTSQIATAQEFDPGRIKANGEAVQGFHHATYQHLAQQRARILYYNVQPQGTVVPQVNAQSEDPTPIMETRELVNAIRKDLTASDAALAKIKAAHSKEPEVLKQIALIEKHHTKALDACGMAEEACQNEHGDQAVIGQCCSDMWHELEAAQGDTQKLLKMLKIEKLEPPKKLEVAKSVAK
jgi:hypothetical protein